MSPMSPWGDILTEQLRGDILMDQQHRVRRPIDGGGLSGLACRSLGPARSTREEAADVHCGSGFWGGQRPSLAHYVTGMGSMDGATAAGGRSCCLSSRLSTLVGKSERYGAMSPSVDFGVDLRHTGGQNVDSGEGDHETNRQDSQPTFFGQHPGPHAAPLWDAFHALPGFDGEESASRSQVSGSPYRWRLGAAANHTCDGVANQATQGAGAGNHLRWPTQTRDSRG